MLPLGDVKNTREITMRSFSFALAAAFLWASSPAQAQEAADVTASFAKLVFDGCLPHMKAHASLSAFAKTAGLQMVPPELAGNFLRTQPGIGYLKVDSKFPMLIFGVADGSCRVYARFAPDLEALAAGVSKKMISTEGGFTDGGTSTDIEGPNSVTTVHRYKGRFGGESFAAVLTTTPARNTSAQVSFIITSAD